MADLSLGEHPAGTQGVTGPEASRSLTRRAGAGRQRQHSRAERAPGARRLDVWSERWGDACVVGLAGELDLLTAPRVEEELEAVEATDAALIVLDFTALDFIDTTGVRLVVQAVGRAKAGGRELELRHGPRQVRRSFEIIGLDGLMTFVDQ